MPITQRYWQSPWNCQYPEHRGKFKRVYGEGVINFKISKEIHTIFGETAQVGSREYISLFCTFRIFGGTYDSSRTIS